MLIGRDDCARVIDFGSVLPLNDAVLHTSGLPMSMSSRPPECYLNQEVKPDAAWDVFALGMLLWSLLAAADAERVWVPLTHQYDYACGQPQHFPVPVGERPPTTGLPPAVLAVVQSAWAGPVGTRHASRKAQSTELARCFFLPLSETPDHSGHEGDAQARHRVRFRGGREAARQIPHGSAWATWRSLPSQ